LVRWKIEERANLLVVVEGEDLKDDEMAALGYIRSKVGFYRYMLKSIRDGRIEADIAINERCARFKFVLWNSTQPLVMDDLTLESEGIELENPSFEFNRMDDIRSRFVPDTADILRANLLLARHHCGPECIARCEKWFASMDAFANRHQLESYGRDTGYIRAERGELISGSLQRARPAFLSVPQNIDAYLFDIGDKSRNMIHKAQRLGYQLCDKDYEAYGQDIYEVRVSDPERQGRPIPDYFRSNPPTFVLNRSEVGCPYHSETFVGVKDTSGRLVSYITLFLFGEVAQVNHILCHKEHIKNGVMNLNVMFVVDNLIRHCPWIKCLNYLYIGGQAGGIDLFKRSVGFEPRSFLAYDSVLSAREVAATGTRALANEQIARKKPRAEKLRIGKKDFAREMVPEAALDHMLEQHVGCELVNLPEPKPSDFILFCSRGLNEMAASSPVGTCLSVPFPSKVSAAQYPEISKYLERRFKRNPIGDEGFSLGFKGSKFQALAFFEIDKTNRFCNGRLLLEKLQ
jgi:hypothetical protein